MKKLLLSAVLLMGSLFSFTQELITNGNFSSVSISPWAVTSNSAGTDGWFGPGTCGQTVNNSYTWFGDENEQTGIDNLTEGLYQQISIPANSSNVTLSFRLSVNTLEPDATPYDFFRVNLLNSSGGFLETLHNVDNSAGVFGIPGCGGWFELGYTFPSIYFGQTVILSFEATTDGLYPTIFRLDDVSVFATIPTPCTYSLSTNNYNCNDASANTYNNVVLVNTQNGCPWNASVQSGGSWLTTNSSGNGSGGINIIVSENTGTSPRSGVIIVGDQSFTVTQPGAECTYALNITDFNCPNPLAGTLNAIALVNTQNNCSWTATVTSGNSWMVCSSSGNGSGAIDITVQENTNPSPRSGIVSVGDQSFTVTQPGADCTYSLNINNYVCPNALPATLNSIALVNTQSNCTWSAVVTSGNAWMACSSSGSGSGAIGIIVQENTTTSPRTGTIAIQGQTLTITQPAGSGNGIGTLSSTSMKIFPNPSNGIVQISEVQNANDLIFYDLTGRIIQPVFTSNNNTLVIDFTSESSGIILMKDVKRNSFQKIQIIK